MTAILAREAVVAPDGVNVNIPESVGADPGLEIRIDVHRNPRVPACSIDMLFEIHKWWPSPLDNYDDENSTFAVTTNPAAARIF